MSGGPFMPAYNEAAVIRRTPAPLSRAAVDGGASVRFQQQID